MARAAPSSYKQGRDSVHTAGTLSIYHGVRLKLFKERGRGAENVCPHKGRKHSRSGLNKKMNWKDQLMPSYTFH